MKLYQVMQCNDPYEPDETLAVCTSLESAKNLFPTQLCQIVEGSQTQKGREWINLHTGEKEFIKNFPGRPHKPFIEEIETDVKF